MAAKAEAVRKALYLCFPDQGYAEINTLMETDRSVKYAQEAFKIEEVPERAMLLGLHYSGSINIHGFLWITNKRLLFVSAIKGIKPHAFIRDIPYNKVQRVQFEKSNWIKSAKIIFYLNDTTTPMVFESIVKPEPLQQFVDYLQKKVANPHDPMEAESAGLDPDEDFITALERLNKLKNEGALAEAEFEAAKKKLLGG